MKPPPPKLYLFAISHYCEKARWALELLGIEHEVSPIAPGLHRRVAKGLGASATSLPILAFSDRSFVQGSSAIIDWAEAHATDGAPSLAPNGPPQDATAIEQRLDRVLGVHVRRHYYSEALVRYPETVLPLFIRDLPWGPRALTRLAWPVLRRLMIEGLDLGAAQRIESRTAVEAELDWLDGLAPGSDPYLVGGRLSRVDLTAASLLAPLVRPPKHPTYRNLQVPPQVQEDYAAFAERPSVRRCAALYDRYR